MQDEEIVEALKKWADFKAGRLTGAQIVPVIDALIAEASNMRDQIDQEFGSVGDKNPFKQ